MTSNKCTRHKHACAPMLFCSCVPVLPDGVIGNTWAFGAHVPGSSPGRVVLKFIPDGSGSSIFTPDGSGSSILIS